MVAMVMLLMIPLTGCGKPMVAQDGDVVKVTYTGTLEDGTVFDTTAGSDPFVFTLGANQTIKGFEDAVLGMKVGEYKEVTIPPEDAYGQPTDKLHFVVPRSRLPEGLDPKVGDTLPLNLSNGTTLPVRVLAVNSDNITIDANSELAGKTLIFKIELVDIQRNQ